MYFTVHVAMAYDVHVHIITGYKLHVRIHMGHLIMDIIGTRMYISCIIVRIYIYIYIYIYTCIYLHTKVHIYTCIHNVVMHNYGTGAACL